MKIRRFVQVSIHPTIDERKILEKAVDLLTEINECLIDLDETEISDDLIKTANNATEASYLLVKILSDLKE